MDEKFFDWKGVILSAMTWEIWQNIIVSLSIAFIGGFLAAAGKSAHRCYSDWREKRKNKHKK